MSTPESKPPADDAPEAAVTPAVSQPADARCGFIAVIGVPNAGKSTLVNALVGAKVSIVSHKVQTTRVTLRGICIEGASQLVFIDTPGIFKPRRRLDRAMVESAWGGAGDADIILLLVDAARRMDEDLERLLSRMHEVRVPLVLALNKIDRVEKERLLELAQALNGKATFDATFMISALNKSGIDDLKGYLAKAVPAGPWHYPAEDISDAPMRLLASEITREKIYHRLHEELPYETTVETTGWKEKKSEVRIDQTIFVTRESQKAIVVGKSGAMIKQISMESRRELSKILEKDVHLFLFVKVREDWGDDPERYREQGLAFPKD